jgi:hypothetical protein
VSDATLNVSDAALNAILHSISNQKV